ncbi:CHAD domain-containing protein [Mesorhizobium sp. BR1-1-16]|uniref:CYTH and CHAD domain-containing protein n=1 Tax=Mesorhizobium sp. BR1-1-16 TaxID=2876653 RepID=UPI001CCF25F5|nr:CYTH and CHAD domain-containing protein [Mesorhizobium sp. BR1-1-16]MBZ9937944.1 CHAD domain-containing protein [Mesorhizobium sp. BR1-1-16]
MKMDNETTATAPSEIELKFAVDPSDLAVFRNLAFLADVAAVQTSLSATYFDTDDHALYRAGYALRLRRSAEGTIQTLKGPRIGSAGLFARSEAEWPVPGEALDQGLLESALPGDLLAITAGRLAPVFTIDTERTEWRVEAGGGFVCVSLDQGIINAGDRHASVTEVEFELQVGTIEAAFALAEAAARRVALHLQPLAKSERGFQLLGAAVLPGRQKADPLAPPDITLAIRRMMAGLIEEIAVERPGVLAPGDPEAVHRLRVLLRRLRCLLDVAAETTTTRSFAKPTRTVRRAFRRLGTVRDLDILNSAVPQNAEIADGALVLIAAERQRALAKARRTLGGRRFAATMLDLLAFVEIDAPVSERPFDRKAVLELPTALARRWRRIGRSLRPSKLPVKARHKLRIEAKVFRYTTEFFGEFFPEAKAQKRRAKAEDAVRDMQTYLGRLNDRRNVERLARDHLGGAVTTALGLTASAPETAELRGADRAFKRLVGCKPYWT